MTSTNGIPTAPCSVWSIHFGADAYQQKGDVEKVVAYTGRSLQLNPDNLTSLILQVEMLPLPQYLRSRSADRTRILPEAENDAKWDDAIQAFKKAGGLGQGTLIKTYADDQIAQMKKRKAQEAVASR